MPCATRCIFVIFSDFIKHALLRFKSAQSDVALNVSLTLAPIRREPASISHFPLPLESFFGLRRGFGRDLLFSRLLLRFLGLRRGLWRWYSEIYPNRSVLKYHCNSLIYFQASRMSIVIILINALFGILPFLRFVPPGPLMLFSSPHKCSQASLILNPAFWQISALVLSLSTIACLVPCAPYLGPPCTYWSECDLVVLGPIPAS